MEIKRKINSSESKQAFALLEDARNDINSGHGWLFTDPEYRILTCKPDELESALDELDKLRRKGFYLCGYLSYEAGYFLVDKNNFKFKPEKTHPLINFTAFGKAKQMGRRDVELWLNQFSCELNDDSSIYEFSLSESKQDYIRKVKKIIDYIREGDTYQVNFTMKYKFRVDGHVPCLYQKLRNSQKVPYGAFLHFPGHDILSFSPELFLRKNGKQIESKPMKGTAARGKNRIEDQKLKAWLENDPKNRAENVMIVDLIRNDIGRIANPGTVRVSNLFEVESYQTVHQMISTVSGEIGSDMDMKSIMKGLYPAGSITGAPKIRTMEIIEELENDARGIYTGAIGHIQPNGDFCFNVAIRTLVLRDGHGEMGIGSGIIYESDSEAEYQECLLKGKFLTGINADFKLIETFRYEGKTRQCCRLEAHLARMSDSARCFGFQFHKNILYEKLEKLKQNLPAVDHKIRILLSHDGNIEWDAEPLLTNTNEDIKFVVISKKKISAQNIFRRHKTTKRELYDRLYKIAGAKGAYDIVFLNERDRVAEASRHNIFIEKDNKWLTPPLSEGALNGVFRNQILMDKSREILERPISLNDLIDADKVFLCNSVRGIVQVELKTDYYE
ncbi:MAG: aminodeoxychorismate synthase component I [Calditrichaceae bacterium]